MKTIGIIDGTSRVSTVDYYKLINDLVNKKPGGSNAAQIFTEMESLTGCVINQAKRCSLEVPAYERVWKILQQRDGKSLH